MKLRANSIILGWAGPRNSYLSHRDLLPFAIDAEGENRIIFNASGASLHHKSQALPPKSWLCRLNKHRGTTP